MIISTILLTLGGIGLTLTISGIVYLKRFGTPSACPDPVSLIIAITYKYVVGITTALLMLGGLALYFNR